jgi:hypothetical protein
MEKTIQRNSAERRSLIGKLFNSENWELSFQTESEESTYFLFANKKYPNETIGINDGLSDFYEDVVLTY